MEITRRIEFDAGHRLLHHEGKCQHLHGHRYAVEVTVEAEQLDDVGRVIDFGDIKKTISMWIDEYWDHNVILHREDPLTDILVRQATENGTKQPYILNANPTAENMAMFLFSVCLGRLHPHVRIKKIRLYETPNCWADVSRGQHTGHHTQTKEDDE